MTGYLLLINGLASFARNGALVIIFCAGVVREKLRSWEEGASLPADRRSSLEDIILKLKRAGRQVLRGCEVLEGVEERWWRLWCGRDSDVCLQNRESMMAATN